MKKLLFFSVILVQISFSQSYNWPCQPFDQQHNINGTFCENRPSGSIQRHHFHDGVDIDLAQGNNVYSVINGTAQIGTAAQYGINAYVRVGRYAYVHVDAHPALEPGDPVTAFETIIGATNSWNHIHFKDGYPGGERNALRIDGGFAPFEDPYQPYIPYVHFYENTSKQRFSDNRVSGLVEIVARAYDKTDNGPIGTNNGVLAIGYQIYDESGTQALSDFIENFRFDFIPSSDSYITNVFWSGSNISTYIYTLTNSISTDKYWDTRDYAPGMYKVLVRTEDTEGNTKEFWSDVEIVQQDSYPPERPELISLLGDHQKNWTLNWFANDSLDLAGYSLIFSYWGDQWSENPSISEEIEPADTSLFYEGFSNDRTIFFRLMAYDEAAPTNYSDSSDAYGIRLSADGPEALIVDGFDNTNGYWNKPAHQFAIDYGLGLTEMEIPFNSVSDNAIRMQKESLNNYQKVIWFTGDDQENEAALNKDDQSQIKNYFDNGGSIIISGSQIGSSLVTNGDEQDKAFYGNDLGASFINDNSESFTIEGIEGTIFEGFQAELKNTFTPDVIDPKTDALAVLRYSNGQNAALYKLNGSANVSLLGFPIDQISDPDKKNQLIKLLIQLDPLTSIEREIVKQPESLQLYQNYPNPFNPQTNIRFYLAGRSNVRLAVYDLNGRLVNTIAEEELNRGYHTYTFDAGNLSSGIYIYKLVTDYSATFKKMVLIR